MPPDRALCDVLQHGVGGREVEKKLKNQMLEWELAGNFCKNFVLPLRWCDVSHKSYTFSRSVTDTIRNGIVVATRLGLGLALCALAYVIVGELVGFVRGLWPRFFLAAKAFQGRDGCRALVCRAWFGVPLGSGPNWNYKHCRS
jgi:hypothetical protein